MDHQNPTLKLTVTRSEEIKLLLDLVHDEFFELDDIAYDSEKKILDIPFARCFHWQNYRKVREWLLWRVYEVSVLRCLLRVHAVSEYKLLDSEKVGRYDFNLIRFYDGPSVIEFETCIPLKFTAKVSELRLEYFEIGYSGKARVSFGWLPIPWESGPRFVEDR